MALPYGELIARNITAARARQRLSQASLAARMAALGYGWIRQTVTQAERGQRRVSAEELLGLSAALETTLTVLMFPSPDDEPGYVTLPGGQWIGLPIARRLPDEPTSLVWEGDVPKISSGPIREGGEG